MSNEVPIVDLGAWLHTPAGRYLLQWEQQQLDAAVADAFGYHALQLGLPQLEALRANRMPHRWVAYAGLDSPEPLPFPPPAAEGLSTLAPPQTVALHCEPEQLPLPNACVDLAVLPHTLETARDPHQALREVERVLVPEGRMVIIGLNPASLWGLRQRAAHAGRSLGLSSELFLPNEGEFLRYRRLRDWLRLLSFEVEGGRFGCWRAPLRSEVALERMGWMDKLGERWWPVFGAVYCVVAVKRVRGMRLLGLARRESRRVKAAAPAVAAKGGLHQAWPPHSQREKL
jgi:SAM-dependent methyltransferase